MWLDLMPKAGLFLAMLSVLAIPAAKAHRRLTEFAVVWGRPPHLIPSDPLADGYGWRGIGPTTASMRSEDLGG